MSFCTFSALSLACAGLLASAAAYAADPAPSAADVAAACKADVDKYCPGIKPGDGTLKACMKEHRKELSPDCKKELMEARKAKKD
jgi:hypothetical protein